MTLNMCAECSSKASILCCKKFKSDRIGFQVSNGFRKKCQIPSDSESVPSIFYTLGQKNNMARVTISMLNLVTGTLSISLLRSSNACAIFLSMIWLRCWRLRSMPEIPLRYSCFCQPQYNTYIISICHSKRWLSISMWHRIQDMHSVPEVHG